MEPNWPVLIFNKSVLKQRKFKEIINLLGPTEKSICLDIGSDNGVVSYFLRKKGGTWKSADLDAETVQTIRGLVKDHVSQINGRETFFDDNEFDKVVIVDFLEHIHTDREFVNELYRIMKPGGELIINVPYVKNSLLRTFRLAIGQTDEKHGHVRPGYTVRSLEEILGEMFEMISYKTYSKFFSEVIDTFVVLASGIMKKGQGGSQKGMVITGKDIGRSQKMFRVYSMIYPFVRLFAKLDSILFFTSGYMLIAKAKIRKGKMV